MEEQPKKSLPAEDPSSLQIRIRTIRGLPLLFTKEPTDIVKMIDILFAHICSESVREAVYEVLTLCMNCELEASMKALFRHIGEEPKKGEEVINFVVLWTRSSGQMKEVLRIIEAHARSDAFEVSDADCINRLISCVRMTLPFVVMSASSSRFIGFINRKILPVFDQIAEERKLHFLRCCAESAPYITSDDSRLMLPIIFLLLKQNMPSKKPIEKMNFSFVECILYIFHHLAHKVPNSTNPLCGYKFMTGQPSDRLGEDFSHHFNDFILRLKNAEVFTQASMKKLKRMTESTRSIGLRICSNILKMTKPLHAVAPIFIGDTSISLSWAPPSAAAAGAKRAADGSIKKGRGSMPNLLFKRAIDGLK